MGDKPTLRPYQVENVARLKGLKSAALFNEQRTGKTPTALNLILENEMENQKVLIVTTKSGIPQWIDEYEKWMGKPAVACVGTVPQKKKILKKWTHGLVISIDSLKETKTSSGMLNEIIKQKPQYIVLDEAHKIKNYKSSNAKAMYKFKGDIWRLALTATPSPGKSHDVFGILKFLFNEKYNSFWNFIYKFYIVNDSQVYRNGKLISFKTYDNFKPGMDQLLQENLKEFSTQVKRKEVMPWLPDKQYLSIRLEPTKEQVRYMKELKESYETEHIETVGHLDRCVRYRQICNDPALLGLESKKSPKTEYIKDFIADNEGTPILIFSNFTSYLYSLYETLKKDYKVGLLVGDTPVKVRGELNKDFQNGKFNIFLINITAGKEALTLDRAEVTIFTDKYPPIGAVEQAEDRFIATKKERANKGHLIIELSIKDSFDEHLYKLLKERKDEVMVINEWRKWNESRK